MKKEQITDKEAICLLIAFLIGTSLIIGIGEGAKNDAWIAGFAGMLMVIPMLLVYSRILSLFKGRDLFDILDLTLGKALGKLITMIYIWYAFHLGALVLRNFGEFISTIAMPETPMFVPILCMGSVCFAAAWLGIEVMGRTICYFLPWVFIILAAVILLGIPELHLNYLKPVLANGFSPIIKGGFDAFSFPFAETVVFISVFSALKAGSSPYKVYFWGSLITGILITIVSVRNIAVLGNMRESFYFPSYEAVSRIHIGDFIQRIEVTVSFVFTMGVFIKCSICLLAACKGIGKLFNLQDYRAVVIQTGLLMVYLSYFIYDNIMDMQYWVTKVYPYYALPMQVVLPLVIWILAEIKVRRARCH